MTHKKSIFSDDIVIHSQTIIRFILFIFYTMKRCVCVLGLKISISCVSNFKKTVEFQRIVAYCS